MRNILLTALLCTAMAQAQLTPAQREVDFRTLAGLVSRYYAPLQWKAQVHGAEALNLTNWLARVRSAKDDLEFQEILSEYLGQFKDGHVGFRLQSNFLADALLRADIFDGKLLIYNWSTARYPAARFPLIALGNEVVSIDGRPAMEIVDELLKNNPAGSGRGARRLAALYLFVRSQQLYPKAILLPDESQLVVRNPQGEEATYTITWTKTGLGVTNFPPAVSEGMITSGAEPPVPAYDLRVRSEFTAPLAGEPEPPIRIQGREAESPDYRAVLGLGSRNPYYALPAGFTVRRGAQPQDTFFTGTFMADGLRIGLIRIPNFSPSSGSAAAIAELNAEVAFMQANTDGLVVDCSRNTGGSAGLVVAYMARLTRQPFYVTPNQILPTIQEVTDYDAIATFVEGLSRETWVVTKWKAVYETQRATWAAGNRFLTGPLPIFQETGLSILTRAPLVDDNFPWLDAARQPVGYDKPLIVLADDLSGSGGDSFTASMQDSRRGPVVGVRTWGLGGYIQSFDSALPYTEASVVLTGSLMVRKNPVRVQGYPEAPYIEDLGVVPDIELDFMTRDNLMNQGRPYVAGFTQAIVNRIRQGR